MGEEFRNYLPTAFQNSMVGGIIQISRASSIAHKTIITGVLLITIIGFVYQFWKFMQLYWQYNTVVDIRVLSSAETTLPSVTVCNAFGFMGSKICKSFENQNKGACLSIKDGSVFGGKICECLPERYCDNGVAKDVMVPSMTTYEQVLEKSYHEALNFSFSLKDFVLNCTYVVPGRKDYKVDCDLSHFKQMFSGSTLLDKGNSVCWTLNTVIGRPEMKPLLVPAYGSLILNLTIDDSEVPFFFHPPIAKIAVHNPYQIINSLFYGSTLFMNSRNKFRIKKVVKNLLPSPYETGCIDYMERWQERGGNGPTNNKECINECNLNFSLGTFGCVLSRYVSIPNQEKECKRERLELKQEELDGIAECIKLNCGPACNEETYEVSKESSENHDPNMCVKNKNKELNSGKELRNIITVEIVLNGMETTVYTYRPKFESIEIFSNLGGFIGLWLGISLIALYDFLEMVFLVIVYPCRKFMDSMKWKDRIK